MTENIDEPLDEAPEGTTGEQLDPDQVDEARRALALTGWSVYDNTLLRFVTGKLEDEERAHEIAESGPEGHDLEVRRV